MKIVCITGMDGTGKTTLSRALVAALRERGVRAAYIYGRTYPMLSRLVMALGRLTLLRGANQWRDYAQYATRKRQTMRNPILAAIYTASIFLDYYVQMWLKLLPYAVQPCIVVSDRYIYDTVISDIAVHLNYSSEQTRRAIDLGMRLLPRLLLAVLIDIPEDVAFARKDDMPHIDYLRERRQRYLELADRPEVALLSGHASRASLLQSLLQEIAVRDVVVHGAMCDESLNAGH